MRWGAIALAAAAAAAQTPQADAIRAEVRGIQAEQYDKGRRIACTMRTIDALTSQDEAQILRVAQRCHTGAPSQ